MSDARLAEIAAEIESLDQHVAEMLAQRQRLIRERDLRLSTYTRPQQTEDIHVAGHKL